ncbi:penicillin-binding transpeptidase domain-containing protein [Cellulomonas soli]|uniref:penicillin-binding transpeptidase domain-containing protein n=1 Tax=Cellulomonas soli TaxID=931535 RepID=UPI003F83B495
MTRDVHGVRDGRTATTVRLRRTAALLVVLGLGTVGLTACSADRPGPEKAAQALADGLESGDLGSVVFATDSPDVATVTQVRADTFAPLAPWSPTVEAGAPVIDEQDEDVASVVMDYVWDVGSGTWTYSTTARLARDAEDVWRVTWRPSLLVPDLVDGETLSVERVQAERATVLGAGGSAIVEPRAVVRVGVDKTHVDATGQDAAARELAAALEIDPDEYAARVAAAGEKAFVEAIVVREGDPAYDTTALGAIDGVNLVKDTLPLAPTRLFARPVLGTVGEATAELVEQSDGALVAGDRTGLGGLQRQYDAQLRGLPGLTIRATSADGAAVRDLFHVEPTPGTALETTLVVDLQTTAEQVLAEVAPASAIVALRPSTGEVLAVASGTGGEGMSTATLGQYAPGSTFKVVSTLALLRAGLTPTSTVTCPTSVTVDGRAFQNFPGYPTAHNGDIPLSTAFANSCNTAFIGARDQAPQEALVEAAASLGLVPEASLGFASFLGAVPADADGTAHAASMIGQGQVLASPLGMATVAASVAAGHQVVPVLVRPAATGGTDEAEESPAATSAATPLTDAEAESLRTLMRAVVTEGGATFLQDVPGEPVGAKTGTAQTGSGEDMHNHAWMIAVQGDLAVAVFVETGDFGSTTAGPLMEAFLTSAAAQAL